MVHKYNLKFCKQKEKTNIKQILMIYSLIQADNKEFDFECPAGYYVETYKRGFDEYWDFIQNNVFKDKKRNFKARYIESENTLFLPNHFFYIFENEKRNPVGIVSAQILKKDCKYIANLDYLAVLEDHRGKGLGKLLTRSVMKIFKEDGFSNASLRTPFIHARMKAIRLYKSLGWRIVHKGNWREIFNMQKKYAEAIKIRS